jgi:anaerobic ribonucleoside-triphosphate reductase activating protein
LKLRVAHFIPKTSALGPGDRFVLYLQGCPFKCRGCCSPEWRDTRKGKLYAVSELISLMEKYQPLDGLTISGGEPLLQVSSLKTLIDEVRKNFPNWTIIVFTGYSVEELTEEQKSLLELTDLAVCGPFILETFSCFGLRGSENQKFLYFSERLLPYRKEIEEGVRKVEIIKSENNLLFVGIPILPNLYDLEVL